MCSTRRAHLQYEKKVVQCEEKVHSIRRATSAVAGQGMWCEKKVYGIKNIAPAYKDRNVQHREGHIYSTSRECCAV